MQPYRLHATLSQRGRGLGKHREDLLFRADTDRLIGDFSALDNDKRRDAHDVERGGKRGLFVDIDFADFDVLSLFGNLVDDRGDHPARAAPGCPEVEQNRDFALHDFGLEIIFCDFND